MPTFGKLSKSVGFRNLVGLKNDVNAIRELLDPNAPPPPPPQTQVVTKEKKMSLFTLLPFFRVNWATIR